MSLSRTTELNGDGRGRPSGRPRTATGRRRISCGASSAMKWPAPVLKCYRSVVHGRQIAAALHPSCRPQSCWTTVTGMVSRLPTSRSARSCPMSTVAAEEASHPASDRSAMLRPVQLPPDQPGPATAPPHSTSRPRASTASRLDDQLADAKIRTLPGPKLHQRQSQPPFQQVSATRALYHQQSKNLLVGSPVCWCGRGIVKFCGRSAWDSGLCSWWMGGVVAGEDLALL